MMDSNALKRLQEICPGLKEATITTEPRGFNGWLVHLCYDNSKCANFQVDEGNYDIPRMRKAVERAIIKQLEYHEAHKNEG
jgi:hypothetical protein